MSKIVQLELAAVDQQVRKSEPDDPQPDDQRAGPIQEANPARHVEQKIEQKTESLEDRERRIQRFTRVCLLGWGNALLILGTIDAVYDTFIADVLFFGVTGCGLLYIALTGKWPKISGNE